MMSYKISREYTHVLYYPVFLLVYWCQPILSRRDDTLSVFSSRRLKYRLASVYLPGEISMDVSEDLYWILCSSKHKPYASLWNVAMVAVKYQVWSKSFVWALKASSPGHIRYFSKRMAGSKNLSKTLCSVKARRGYIIQISCWRKQTHLQCIHMLRFTQKGTRRSRSNF